MLTHSKHYAAVLLAALMLLSAGCSSVPTSAPAEKNTQQQTQQTKDTQDTEKKAPQKTAAVNEKIGLSDTLAAWEKAVGHAYAQGDTIKSFQNGAYQVVFEDDQAVTITFAATDGKNPVEASMLPRDGKKQSESSKKTGGVTMISQRWHSDALAKAMPETKGSYTLIKNMNGKTYDSVIVDCTPNLGK